MVPLHRRPDGSYVVRHLSGLPFHITRDDPAWAEVDATAPADLPPEPGPPPPPPPPTRWLVPKMVVVRRMTVAEAAALRALLATLDAKTQTLWETARELWSDDPDVLAAVQALGWTPARVAELLAPESAG